MCSDRARRHTPLMLGLSLILTLSGCGYGALSPAAYEYAKALYGLSNRQASERLEAVRQQIEAARQTDEISAEEGDWLLDIVADGEAGRWDAAASAARRMMEDQVRR